MSHTPLTCRDLSMRPLMSCDKFSKQALIYSVRGEPFDKLRANGPK